MRPGFLIVGAGVLLPVLLAFVTWQFAFLPPAHAPLPVPGSLFTLDSKAGRELLSEPVFLADHGPLRAAFEPQARRAWCGVASAVMVINALTNPIPRMTQDDFFTDAARKVHGPLRTTFGGMTLDQFAGLLRAHGLEARAYHASSSGIDAFRALAKANLATGTDMLVVNYQRAALGQEEMGHISPVAAYNAATDRLLVLDVASHKYPPVWVSVAALWKAMDTMDDASGQTRGFVIVARANADSSRKDVQP